MINDLDFQDILKKVDILDKRIAELEQYTTGENGYMIISVPVGSYVLPPNEVNRQMGIKLPEQTFTEGDLIDFGKYVYNNRDDIPESKWSNYSYLFQKWKEAKENKYSKHYD